MKNQKVAILHYTAPPIIGGVEAVIKAHLNELIHAGYPSSVIAGRGHPSGLPEDVDFIKIPEIDSQHPDIIKSNQALEAGRVPKNFENQKRHLVKSLEPVLRDFDHLIIHNIFTKHFNLALSGALHDLLDLNRVKNTIVWCHDFSWTSPNSKSKVHPGYPWDLLRTKRPDCTYVTISKDRQRDLAGLFKCKLENIRVIYNGVDPQLTLGLSQQGVTLINYLGLMESELNIIMPVRITQAKNIEFALHVLAELKNLGVKPKLVVTGPPDPHEAKSMRHYQSLRDLREKLNVRDNMQFIFESGPHPEEPFFINEKIVGDLYRVSDVMFMPSHREGFGMPILEAGLAGIPVLSRPVPAAQELAESEAAIFRAETSTSETAYRLLQVVNRSPIANLRRRVRRQHTWRAIFNSEIQPLLQAGNAQ